MKSLRRKGNFKRPSEKRGKFNDRGRSIKKEIKVYIKEQNMDIGKEILQNLGDLTIREKVNIVF